MLVLRALVVAAAVPLLFRLPLSTVDRLLGRPARRRRIPTDPAHLQDLVAGAAQLASPVVRSTCLTRGVPSYHLLRRDGVDVRLVFGVGEPGGEVAAHCWLERDGEPFLEDPDPRSTFRPVYALGPEQKGRR